MPAPKQGTFIKLNSGRSRNILAMEPRQNKETKQTVNDDKSAQKSHKVELEHLVPALINDKTKTERK